MRLRSTGPRLSFPSTKAKAVSRALARDDAVSTAPQHGHQRARATGAAGSGQPGHTFYLGTHQIAWLERLQNPLCVSVRRLLRRERFPERRPPGLSTAGGSRNSRPTAGGSFERLAMRSSHHGPPVGSGHCLGNHAPPLIKVPLVLVHRDDPEAPTA